MSLCYVNIYHKNFLFGGLLKVIVLYCIVLYCIVLYCIVLYCIVLYCIVLYCIVCYNAGHLVFAGKLNFAVSRRVQDGVLPTTGPLQGGDVRTLANMAHHVKKLRARLTSLSGEVTPGATVYLAQMQCLESLVDVMDSAAQ